MLSWGHASCQTRQAEEVILRCMENVLNKNKTQHKEFINCKTRGQRDNGHGSNNDLEKSGTVAVINTLDMMR